MTWTSDNVYILDGFVFVNEGQTLIIEAGAVAGKRVITFRDNAGGEYYNSIFAEQAKGIDIGYREDGGGSSTGQCSYSQWADAGIFKVASEQNADKNDLFTVPAQANTDFATYFATAENMVSDAGVDNVHPTASGDVNGANFEGMDAWFEMVNYKGAFKPNENWAKEWTLALGDVEAKINLFIAVGTKMVALNLVKVYPNPVVSLSTVEFENAEGLMHSFTIFDMAGHSVTEGKLMFK